MAPPKTIAGDPHELHSTMVHTMVLSYLLHLPTYSNTHAHASFATLTGLPQSLVEKCRRTVGTGQVHGFPLSPPPTSRADG